MKENSAAMGEAMSLSERAVRLLQDDELYEADIELAIACALTSIALTLVYRGERAD
jgi:hypothetical protein